MWILLLRNRAYQRNGKMKEGRKGTIINIGKMDAMRWIDEGAARAVDFYVAEGSAVTGECGVVAPRLKEQAEKVLQGLTILGGEARVAFEKTLVWDGGPLRSDLISAGWRLLDHWQAAIPLCSYTELAINVSTPEDREQTRQVIRDLRVPLYDTRLMFLRKCGDTERLLELWNAEKGKGDVRLAFLRALYTVKPIVCALPTVWAGKE